MSMSSPPALVAWQQRYVKDIAQVAPNPKVAQQKLELAGVHVARANELLRRSEYDLALNSAENALVVSCDGILRKDGYEVRSHVARFAYPLLPALLLEHTALLRRIRTTRNAAQYEASGVVPRGLAVEAIQLASDALIEVTKAIAGG
jgi:hypothetical protein